MGIDIFLHSIRLVTRHFGDALRISGLLYLGPALISVIVLSFAMGNGSEPLVITLIVVAGLAYTVALLWMVVAWHRFILLHETPRGLIPQFKGDRVLAYFGSSLAIAVVLILIAIALGIVVALASGGSPAVALALGALVIFVLLIFHYRLALVLPAAAIAKPLGFGESWRATKKASGEIVVLALVSTLASLVLDLPWMLLGHDTVSAIVRGLWQLAAGWIKLMVGVSILTTLYGHFIEGRPVSDEAIS